MIFAFPRCVPTASQVVVLAAAALLVSAAGTPGSTGTIAVALKLRTGGALRGLVVQHTDHGLVVVSDRTPYVFAWKELESGSAYVARRELMAGPRGGVKHLTAQDHFQLGRFILKLGRNDLAAMEFRKAADLDAAFQARGRSEFARIGRDLPALKPRYDPFDDDPHGESTGDAADIAEPAATLPTLSDAVTAAVSNDSEGNVRARVFDAYRLFGEKVREVMGKEVELIETDHFLIWTDFEARDRDRLALWCEAMYSALCRQFRLDPTRDVFLAKCPVFCWRVKARFRRFARLFDGYAGNDAIGYTRSIEASGHVHVVLLRQGRSEVDLDRFACTLVHEGTHAFLHRLYTPRLIPHWINEGLAELVSQRVLGDRCTNAANATLLAETYVRYEWPISDLLRGVEPIGVEQYPLAYSVVAYLEELGPGRFAGLIRGLKEGQILSEALATHYDRLTLKKLEAGWRSAVRSGKKQADRPDEQSASDPSGSRRAEEPLFNVRLDVMGITYRNVSGTGTQMPILEQNGQGIGIIDYDNDGWLDLFVSNGSTEARWRRNDNPGCRLYRNLGGWRFADVTDEAGVRGGAWSSGVAVADYDADGDFDIYVLQWGPNVLYRNNGDGTFTDVTSSAGVGDPRWSSSAAFADFNGDGLLDIYVANYVHFDYDSYPTKEKDGGPCLYRGVETGCGPWCYEGQRDTLYLNVGGGRFEDRSNAAGLACTRRSRSFGVVATDFDGDGDVDIYVGCDVMENLYLENVGDATFVSVGRRKGGALNGAGDHESGMGVAATDFDRTGTVDLLVTNFSGQTNTFYRNDRGILSDATTAIRLDPHPIEMGWGVCAWDFNQDAMVDVFVANGHIYPQVVGLSDPKESYAQRPRLYLQNRDGRLEEVPTAKAFGRPVSFCLRGCAAGDLDNDGDLDLVALRHNGPLVFFENLCNRRRKALVVELVDRQGGRSPMGARVRMDGGPWHWMLPNQGYQSSHDHRLFLPLRPDDRAAPPLEVGWPDGTVQRYQLEQWGRRVIRLRQRAAKSPT